MQRLPSWLIWGIHYTLGSASMVSPGVPGEFNCEDDIDNDGNGHMDCDDSQCESIQPAVVDCESACQNRETMATD